jgi:hypothetical protein
MSLLKNTTSRMATVMQKEFLRTWNVGCVAVKILKSLTRYFAALVMIKKTPSQCLSPLNVTLLLPPALTGWGFFLI